MVLRGDACRPCHRRVPPALERPRLCVDVGACEARHRHTEAAACRVRRENRTGWRNTAEEASGGSPVWELSV